VATRIAALPSTSMNRELTQLKSEVNIIAELANGLFGAKPVDWLALCGDYRLIRDHIEQVIDGFDNFNQRLSELGEFVLPNPVRDSLTFRTENGKARFIVQTNDWVSAQKTRLLLMTLRSHDQFNTTVYTDDDRYRGVFGSREVIFMNPEDMEARGLEENHLVDINSFSEASDAESKCVKGYRVIPYGIPKGCVAAYYPEVNNLVHLADVALHSNTPAYKSVLVEVSPTQGIKEA
jgi:anaerobic selenocysteine-containing dehydrogenase